MPDQVLLPDVVGRRRRRRLSHKIRFLGPFKLATKRQSDAILTSPHVVDDDDANDVLLSSRCDALRRDRDDDE